MSLENDVVIPTFINVHLFWIIQKKDIILRLAMSKIMKEKCVKAIKSSEEICEEQMVAVNVDGIWARGIVENLHQTQDEIKYICWLLDYGVMRTAHCIFQLPSDLEKCPPLAKQASLHNVVNLTMDLIMGNDGYNLELRKTVNGNQGIIKAALEYLGGANKTIFTTVHDDGDTTYGDIILVYKDNNKNSLTESLIEEKLLALDEEMFKTIDSMRTQFKEAFFQNSQNWQQKLDLTEKQFSKSIYNKDKNSNGIFYSAITWEFIS